MVPGSAANGRVVVVSGPSGAGKSTVMHRLFHRCPLPLVSSVSATTRPSRPGEVDGRDYHFLSPEEFHQRRRRNEFIECFRVFGGDHWYGTLAGEVTAGLAAGKWVILEIDVQGAEEVARRYPQAVTIFLCPSSIEELERRLRGRATESEEAIQQRLEQARQELAAADRYRYHVVNDDVGQAAEQICQILTQQAENQRND